jgi:mannose-6-phosphate isomerase
MIQPRPYRLENTIQHYSWGTRDRDALIPRLLGIKPEAGVPYAELWMGAHSRGPSKIRLGDRMISLRELIRRFPEEALGQAADGRYQAQLPFLFKVISVGESLSIQAHPARDQAAQLHRRDPEHYPDANHKPEVAIALDSLDLLAGFKSWPELVTLLNDYPEIVRFIDWPVPQSGNDTPEKSHSNLQELIGALLRKITQDPEALESTLEELSRRAGSSPRGEEDRLFLQLREKYTGPDPGLLLLYFMQRRRLERGRAIFLKPGVPHAYLYGNIVEIMANSDNVIRAGLTPKYTDIPALTEILDFRGDLSLEFDAVDKTGEKSYPIPVDEFRVAELVVRPGEERRIVSGNVPEILLIYQGSGWIGTGEEKKEISAGASFFIPAVLSAYQILAGGGTRVFRVSVPEGGRI